MTKNEIMELLELRKNELLEICNCFETFGMCDGKCYSNVIAQYGVLSSIIYDINCAELHESLCDGLSQEESRCAEEYVTTFGYPKSKDDVDFIRSCARRTARHNSRMTVKEVIDLDF